MQISEETKVIKVYESFILGVCKCGCSTELDRLRNTKGFFNTFRKGHNERLKNKTIYHCEKCRDKNFLIECKCGCAKVRPKRDKQGHIQEFLFNHHFNLEENKRNQWGFNNNQWKTGRTKKGDYWYIRIDGEYVREHIYFYEQYNKVCVLPWTVVHHINEDKEMNMPWNLTTMMWNDHSIYHNPKTDMSDRRCVKCYDITNSDWYYDENKKLICNKCYLKYWRKNKKNK